MYDILAHLTFTHDLSSKTMGSIDAPMWTMPVDVQFYIALPLAAYVLYGFMRTSNARIRSSALAGMAIVLVVSSISFRIFVVHRWPIVTESFQSFSSALRQLSGMLPEFVAGVAATRLVPKLRMKRGVARLCFLTAAVIFVVFAFLAGHAPYYPALISTKWLIWIGFQEVVVALAALATVVGAATVSSGPLDRIFSLRFTERAAELSYAVYLVHEPILYLVAPYFLTINRYLGYTITLLAVVLLSCIVAIPLYEFVEKPFLRMKDPRQTVGALN